MAVLLRVLIFSGFIVIYCSGCQSSASAEKIKNSELIVEAKLISTDGVKTISTEAGPHRSIEYFLFELNSPENLKGRKMRISAETPHGLIKHIRFSVDEARINKFGKEDQIRLNRHEIKLIPVKEKKE